MTLHDYIAVLRRRAWIIVQPLVLLPLAAFAFSILQSELYRASAEVLISRQSLAATVTGQQDPNQFQDPDRAAETQAHLARVPAVASRVVISEKVSGLTAREFLGASEVAPRANTDLLQFTVDYGNPDVARRLATAYAREFTLYRRELDTRTLQHARVELHRRIRQLENDGVDRSSPLYANLVDSEQRLRTLEALQTSNTSLVRAADRAEKIRPQTFRNTLIGFALGAVLGLALAFLREALDRRVRTKEEVESLLNLPVLAQLPQPPRKLRRRNTLVMLAEPEGAQAEAFRRFRTNLEFVNLERGARTIMVTSAAQREGKSTTVANLAVALARGGAHVALVDLDLRQPFLDRFFDLGGRPGLTDVALGRVRLDDAAAKIRIPLRATAAPGENGRAFAPGLLEVLTAGRTPPNAGEFVASKRVRDVLAQLRERADVVIIDAPPILVVGDAFALSAHVDALFVVARLNQVRREMLTEMSRFLNGCPCEKLGVVVTGAALGDGYGYGTYHHDRADDVAAEVPAR